MNRTGIRYLLIVCVLTAYCMGAVAGGRNHSGSAEIRKKLRTIVLPRVKFENATIAEVIEFLRHQSKLLDPEMEGINFFLVRSRRASERPVNMTMSRIPLETVLSYTCMGNGLEYRVEDGGIVVSDIKGRPSLVTRFYPLSAGNPFHRMPTKDNPLGIQKFFESKGVRFPPGARISYFAANSRLAVTNTHGNQRRLERVLYELGLAEEPE